MSIGNADVAELVDALVLGTSANGVGVRVPSSAPTTYLFELTDRYEINQKWLIFLFVKKFIFYFSLYCLSEHPSFDRMSKLVMFAMAKLMEMETTEQNKVYLYLFNSINS